MARLQVARLTPVASSSSDEGAKFFLSHIPTGFIQLPFKIIYFRYFPIATDVKIPGTLLPLEESSLKSVCVYCLYSEFMLLYAFFHMQIAVTSLFWAKSGI